MREMRNNLDSYTKWQMTNCCKIVVFYDNGMAVGWSEDAAT
jgi:hypothetical protein